MIELQVSLGEKSYSIFLREGVVQTMGTLADLDRKVLVVTDTGVPRQYAQTVLSQCGQGHLLTVPMGEGAKSFAVYQSVCETLLSLHFTRNDCIVALGGGVVGDLAGFAAATYMRGIDFYGVPTTTLSQIDSSIGGKTGINLAQVKNIVGAFHQPRAVFIDPQTLSTLSPRHFVNGLAEAVKAGLIYDPALFSLFEQADVRAQLGQIILRALQVKKTVVEQDEKENSLRKILNFGHTIGHGIESAGNLGDLLHGEAVALGMLPMIEDDALRARVKAVYQKLGLPASVEYDKQKVFAAMRDDKKSSGGTVSVVKVKALGQAVLEEMSWDCLYNML